jgi:hypothetical protein
MKQVSGSLFRDLGLFEHADNRELARSTDALFDALVNASEAERVTQITGWIKASGGPTNGLSPERIHRFVRLWVRHVAMIDTYRPVEVQAPLISWRTRGAATVGPTLKSLTTGSFTEDTLDCAHYEILQPPFVQTVAVALDEALLGDAEGGLPSKPVADHGVRQDDRRRLQVHG